MIRTKLKDRVLPDYTRGEEIMNMVTHITGGGLGIIGMVLCILQSVYRGSATAIVSAAIYGSSMVALYTMSSIYHGLRPGIGKKVMQIIDHCTIYFLIAGTYTPIVLCTIAPQYPAIGWGLFGAEWLLAILASVLTAIDLRRFRVFSMICYIGMGWGVIFFLPQAMAAMTPTGFWILFAGGIAYTIGAVLFGLGKKLRWMHSVFHIFVVLGTVLQLIAVLFFVL
ncbi:MAG: hemolysin III family protein [Oscillospiraceae bacterium]|nr:hemolysin III family protein [Oscillospiraceae bacterium]